MQDLPYDWQHAIALAILCTEYSLPTEFLHRSQKKKRIKKKRKLWHAAFPAQTK